MRANLSFKVASGQPVPEKAGGRRRSASVVRDADAAIVLTGWDDGLDKVGLTRLLRDRGGLSLSRAKSAVDDLLAGHRVVVGLSKVNIAPLLKQARALGAQAERG